MKGAKIQAVGLLLIAAAVGFVLGVGWAKDDAPSTGRSENRASASGPTPGTLDLSDLGLKIHFPSEWTGEDTIIAGKDISFDQGREWTVHAFTRQEGVQAFLGAGPTLLIRIVTSDTDAGRTAIAAYFEKLSNLKSGEPTVAYDIVLNKASEMTTSGLVAGGLLMVNSTGADTATAFASQAYYQLSDGRLYVVAYVRSEPGEIAVDQPLIQEILKSLAIAN
ncbi:MAG TPA: hypothetical protein VI876_08810 [Dehalococcoidia bacterium]|nr:hypothetical protein [Dehalococcoidia bacterium]